MTHRALPTFSRSVLLAALAAGVPAVAAAQGQAKTPAAAPAPTSPKAFAAGVAGVKAQVAALVKQSTDKVARTQKAAAAAEADKAKLAAKPETPTKKDELAAFDTQIGKLKEQLGKLEQIKIEIASLDAQIAAIAAEPACASDSKGVKPKLAAAKRTVDGVIGSSTSEIALTKTDEKAQTAPKMKQVLSAYAKDVQAVATSANAVATSLVKLQDQAAKLAACP